MMPDRAPFAGTVALYLLAFTGLAPCLPLRRHGPHDDWATAAHPFSLKIVLAGALVVLPFIIGDTLYACRVFRGAPAMQPGNRYTMLPRRTGIELASVWSHSRDCPDTRKDNS